MSDQNNHVEDVEHEEIDLQPGEQTTEALPIEKVIQSEIKKFSLPDRIISEMKAKFSGLKINGVDDTKGLKEVSAARSLVRTKRTGIEKKRKELKASYLETGRAIDAEAKRLTDLLLEIETPLDTEVKKIEDEKERVKQEAQRIENERLQARVTTLIDNGVSFTGAYYSIGDSISLDVVTIKEMIDEQFNELLRRVQAVNKQIQDAKAEEKRLEEERILNLQKQQKEQEEERQRLENEKLEMKRQRVEFRLEVLVNAGFVKAQAGMFRFTTPDAGFLLIGTNEIEDLTPAEWDAKFSEIKTQVKNLRELQAEKDEEKRLHDEKVSKLRERDKQRRKVFSEMGLIENDGKFFIRTLSFGDTNFYEVETLLEYPDEEFNKALETVKVAIEETRRQDAENMLRTEREKTRSEILKSGYGFEFRFASNSDGKQTGGEWFKKSKFPVLFPSVTVLSDNLGRYSDEEFNEYLNEVIKPALADLEKKEADETNKQARDIELRRQAALSDIERINEYFTEINKVHRPLITNLKVETAFKLYLDSVDNSKAILFKTLDTIK